MGPHRRLHSFSRRDSFAMRRVFFTMVVVVLAGQACSGQAWSDKLFLESAHDFGTVARGTKLRYTFWLVNTTNSEIKILSWRAKCGCTDVKVGAREIPPGTRTPIEATLDTTRFQGTKNSGLTLVLNGPEYAEKDLNLSCFIRGDVLLDPGVADFGILGRAAVGKAPVVMNFSYLGNQPGWKITGAKTISPHVTAEILGPYPATSGGVQFQIKATLNPSIPTGYFKDEITLATNDPSSPTIPISVVANVQAAVVVTPGNLVFGRVKAGSIVTKEVLVKSTSQTFKILGTTSAKGDVTASKPSDKEGQLHRMTITLKAPLEPGPYNAEMEVSTSLKDEPIAKFMTYATVVP